MSALFRITDRALEFNDEHDIRIFALGYESRSRALFEKLGKPCQASVALAFPQDRVLAWKKNKGAFESAGVEVVECSDEGFSERVAEEILSGMQNSAPVQAFIDISSFSRFRLACLVELVAKLLPLGSTVTFGYAVAEFTDPGNDEVPITKFAPVTRHFAGVPSDPELPLVAILGLGYDQGRALGAIEYLEIGEAWLLKPVGADPRYCEALESANSWLLEASRDYIVDYNVETPVRTYANLWSLARSCLIRRRPLLIPFGPKIFALCSMLLAENLYPRIPIWHVSSSMDVPVDRKPKSFTSVVVQLVARETSLEGE